MCIRDRDDAYLSIWFFCLVLGIPAVSIIWYFWLFKLSVSFITSLVVPDIDDTTERSFSNRELNNVDLPELGLPIKTIEFSLLRILDFVESFFIFFEIPLVNSSIPVLWIDDI